MSCDLSWTETLAYLKSVFDAALVSAPVLAIIAWLGKMWADRRLEKAKAEFAGQIEKMRAANATALEHVKGDVSHLGRGLQAVLDRRTLVFKSQFEAEFAAIKAVWEQCDECADISGMILQLVQRSPVDMAAALEEYNNSVTRYDTCRQALIAVRRQRPFLSADIFEQSKDLLIKAVKISNVYRGIYWDIHKMDDVERKRVIKEFKEDHEIIYADYERLAETMARRIAQFSVIDA